MQSNYLHSEKSSLLVQLHSSSEKFDYVLNLEEDFEAAKIIYMEIKTLRERLVDLNQQSGSDL